jgi:hypothetical protein
MLCAVDCCFIADEEGEDEEDWFWFVGEDILGY